MKEKGKILQVVASPELCDFLKGEAAKADMSVSSFMKFIIYDWQNRNFSDDSTEIG